MPLLRVRIRPQEMERHVGFRPFHPAVVSGGDVEQVARPERKRLAVVHDDAAPPRHHEPDVLHLAGLRSDTGGHVRGPLPAGVVAGASHHEVSDLHHLERSFFEAARFVWAVEAPEDRVFHGTSPYQPPTMVSSILCSTTSTSQAASGLQSNAPIGGSTRRIGSTNQSVRKYAGRNHFVYRWNPNQLANTRTNSAITITLYTNLISSTMVPCEPSDRLAATSYAVSSAHCQTVTSTTPAAATPTTSHHPA